MFPIFMLLLPSSEKFENLIILETITFHKNAYCQLAKYTHDE